MTFLGLDGVSRFFQWLYTAIVGSWNTFSIIIWVLIFIGIQVGFIYLYVRLFQVIMILEPKIKQLIYKVDRFFS
jgi:hypothetical protein